MTHWSHDMRVITWKIFISTVTRLKVSKLGRKRLSHHWLVVICASAQSIEIIQTKSGKVLHIMYHIKHNLHNTYFVIHYTIWFEYGDLTRELQWTLQYVKVLYISPDWCCTRFDIYCFKSIYLKILTLCEECPNTEFVLIRIFPHSDWMRRDTPYLSVFSPNVGKYGREKTLYLDPFHEV